MSDGDNTTWLTIGGLILSFVFFLVGALLTVRYGRTSPKIRYRLKVWEVIGVLTGRSPGTDLSDERLLITYDGHKVETVSKVYLAVWNSRGTLRGEDARTKVPFQLVLPRGCEVLGTPQVRARTRDPNEFEVATDRIESHRVNMTFDYLNNGDGALIELLVSGDAKGATVIGEFRGASGPRDEGELDLRQRQTFRGLLTRKLKRAESIWIVLGGLFAVLFTVVGLIAAIVLLVQQNYARSGRALLLVLAYDLAIGAITLVLLLASCWILVQDYSWVNPKRRIIPRELRFFPSSTQPPAESEDNEVVSVKSNAESCVSNLSSTESAVPRSEVERTE